MARFLGNLEEDKYDRQYTDGYLMRRMFSYFKPTMARFIAVNVLGLILSLALALGPIVIAEAVGALEGEAALPLAALLWALVAVVLSRFFLNLIRRRLTGRLIGDVVAQVMKDAFGAALKRDIAFYDENKSGKILSRITNDTDEFGRVLILTSDVLSQVVQAVFLLVVLLTINIPLSIITLLFIPLVMGTASIFRRLARNATRQGSRAGALVNDNIQESVTGISVAKNFRQEAVIYRAFDEVNRQAYHINLRKGLVISAVFPTLGALTGLATAALLYFGGQSVVIGVIDIAVWYLFIQSIEQFWFPLINISSFWSEFQSGMSALERIFALIDAENTIKQQDNQPVEKLRGQVTFENVTFGYRADNPVLKDFDLNIGAGESVAFVGHTGAGKSSIAKLIMRFYEFQGGRILIDGRDIRTFDLSQYQHQIGFIPQRPFLFSGTIAENIRYTAPHASDEEIEQVAHSIGDGEWLEAMPEGIYTSVGERGSHLSMGQRQLVSLLRVLVQKPAIFILDEATASVDPFTESQIQEALDLVLSRSTSILIAHRLSTVRSADRIIVLKQGAIIEEGSHQSLMAQGGHYADLYNTYFRHQSLGYVEEARTMFDLAPRKTILVPKQGPAASG